MAFALSFVIGIVLGIGAILPGVSGGVLAVALGYYEKMLTAVATFFRAPRKNFLFLLPIGLGAALGIYGVAVLLNKLLVQYESEVYFLFIGLVIGSLPAVFRQSGITENFKKRYIFVFLASALVVVALLFFIPPAETAAEGFGGVFAQFMAGVIVALGLVFPGISASVVMMLLGVYNELMAAVSGMRVLELIPAGLGLCVGVIAFIKFVSMLMRRFRAYSYSAVIGFMTGTIVAMLRETDPEPLLMCVFMLVAGAAAAIGVGKLERKHEG